MKRLLLILMLLSFISAAHADYIPVWPIVRGGTGNTSGNATTVTNGIYNTDSGTVTNLMLAGSIANSKLLNASTTVNGQTCTLGASCTVTAAASITNGSTAMSGFTNGYIPYNNSSTVGQYAISGSGTVAMTASPTFTGTLTGNGAITAAQTTAATSISNVVPSNIFTLGANAWSSVPASAAANLTLQWTPAPGNNSTPGLLDFELMAVTGVFNANNEVRFNGVNSYLNMINSNDSAGGFFGESYSTAQFGYKTNSGSPTSYLGLTSGGVVETLNGGFGFNPNVQNILDDSSGNMSVIGNISIVTSGKGLQIKSGSNARIGTGTLSGGTLTIANTSVTANTRVFLQDTTSGALTNVGILTAVTTAGTGFVVKSTLALDTSTFNWMLVESQ